MQLENLLIKFDKNEMSFSELTIHVLTLQKNFEDVYSDLISSFKTNAKFNVAKDCTKQMQMSLAKIQNSDEQNISSSIRYEIISFVLNRHHFLSCF